MFFMPVGSYTLGFTAFLVLATGLVPFTTFSSLLSFLGFFVGKGLTGRLGRTLSNTPITTIFEPGCKSATIHLKINDGNSATDL